MSKIDPRYKRGQIYCVRCRYDDNLIYVGSTINILSKRFNNHKINENCSLYKYVDGDWDNWYIELYENYPCNNKPELNKREGEVQRDIATINNRIAGRTKKEYYYENSNKILEKNKQYRQNNHKKVLEQKRQHYKDNRDKLIEQKRQKTTCNRCGSIVRKDGLKEHELTKKCINFKPS